MMTSAGFECTGCGRRVRHPVAHDCSNATVRLVHDFDRVREQFDLANSIENQWHYEPLFPMESESAVSLGEGGTPLVTASTLGNELDVDLTLKLEGSNPTGSTKDRGSSLLVSAANSQERSGVACASTGNAASSVAAYAARASLPCQLFIPGAPAGTKALQSRIHGASVTPVEGTYERAFEQCATVAETQEWADRSAGESPYTAAGARTLGYEIAEQTDDVPDWVVVPVGNGGTIADTWDGLETFAEIGFVPDTPRLLGVQTTQTCPIVQELDGTASAVESAGDSTDADSIDVSNPRRKDDAKRAIQASDGHVVAVSDEAIQEAIRRLARDEGVFAEPASAATVAAIERARAAGRIDSRDDVVAVVTGSGLKDVHAGRRAVESVETES